MLIVVYMMRQLVLRAVAASRAKKLEPWSVRLPRLRAPLGDMRTRSRSTHRGPEESTWPTQYLPPFTLRTWMAV